MKKVLLVFGTRPEAIKMAPLVKTFQKNNHFETKVCVTAQHREMLDQVLDIFDIDPEYDLNLMKPGQDLYDITANVLKGMKDVLNDFSPDIVLVHGDTTTSATSLAAFYQKIKVGHVEAGLRTHDIYSPWPEEANRQIVGVLATYHFAPTQTSADNLLRENKLARYIKITDDVRESPALYITKQLIADGFDVVAVEPNIDNHREINLIDYKEALIRADVFTFLVAHQEFKDLEITTDLDFCGVLN